MKEFSAQELFELIEKVDDPSQYEMIHEYVDAAPLEVQMDYRDLIVSRLEELRTEIDKRKNLGIWTGE